jgi:hypothetical protein
VQRAISVSPEAIAERAQRDVLPPAITAAKEAFDPVLGVRGGWRQVRTPASSILQRVNGRFDDRFWTQSVEWKQRLPWFGMRWESTIESQRVATSNPFTSLNPYYQLLQRDTLVVPLARFRKADEFRTDLRIRQREQRAGGHELEAHLIELVHRVEAAYWTLAAAREGMVAAASIERAAMESLSSTERQVKEGEMVQAELAGARAGQTRPSRPELARKEPNGKPRPSSKSLLTASATATHPELLALVQRMEGQQEQIRLAASAAAPQNRLGAESVQARSRGKSVLQGNLFPGFNLDAPANLRGGWGERSRKCFEANSRATK